MKQLGFLTLLLILVGCTKVLPTEEYIKMANKVDGPLVSQIDQGGFTFNCFYRPIDFYIAQAASLERKSPNDVKESVQQQHGDCTYFIISIDSEKYNPNMMLFGHSFSEGESMKLLYGLSPNFELVSDKRTIECEVATINRSWGNSKEVSLLLVFPKVNDKELSKYQLKIRDFGLGCGTVMVPLKKVNPIKIALQF